MAAMPRRTNENPDVNWFNIRFYSGSGLMMMQIIYERLYGHGQRPLRRHPTAVPGISRPRSLAGKAASRAF